MGLALAAPSCFDGAGALGLPCLSDDDCGVDQACQDGFCGGPPATGTSTSTGTDTSTDTSTSTDSTTTTGVDSSSSGTGLPACGNGVTEAELGEECDPGTGLDTEQCDADCTLASCGDSYVNTEAGEECDEGDDDSNLDACTVNCRETLFWDDFQEDPADTRKWTFELPSIEFEGMQYVLDAGWQWGVPEPGVMHSGPYSESTGSAQMWTAVIDFPDLPEGFQYEMHFRHRYRFDNNVMDQPNFACGSPTKSDGGVVMIQEMMGMPRPAGPPMGHPDMLDDAGGCGDLGAEPTNPLYDEMMPRPAYTDISPPQYTDESFFLPDVEGKEVRLFFEIGYDCTDCWGATPPMGAGWFVDDVVVAAFPEGGG